MERTQQQLQVLLPWLLAVGVVAWAFIREFPRTGAVVPARSRTGWNGTANFGETGI